jgi:hypothetical protein
MRWLCAILMLTALARAEEDSPEKAQARLLLGQGNALFEKGDLKGALVDFRAAYALYPSPKLLVNAAAAERELGDLPGAANDLRHFLDEAPSDDPFLSEKAAQDLKAIEKKVGRIALAGWPAKTAVEVDGRPGRDPAYVKPGEHHVRARTPAGAEVEKDLTVGAGESVDLAAPPLTGEVAAPPTRRDGPRTTPKKSRWWVGVVVGTVLVAAGVGVGVGLGLGLKPTPQPLTGDLGIYKFSDFH